MTARHWRPRLVATEANFDFLARATTAPSPLGATVPALTAQAADRPADSAVYARLVGLLPAGPALDDCVAEAAAGGVLPASLPDPVSAAMRAAVQGPPVSRLAALADVPGTWRAGAVASLRLAALRAAGDREGLARLREQQAAATTDPADLPRLARAGLAERLAQAARPLLEALETELARAEATDELGWEAALTLRLQLALTLGSPALAEASWRSARQRAVDAWNAGRADRATLAAWRAAAACRAVAALVALDAIFDATEAAAWLAERRAAVALDDPAGVAIDDALRSWTAGLQPRAGAAPSTTAAALAGEECGLCILVLDHERDRWLAAGGQVVAWLGERVAPVVTARARIWRQALLGRIEAACGDGEESRR